MRGEDVDEPEGRDCSRVNGVNWNLLLRGEDEEQPEGRDQVRVNVDCSTWASC